MGKLYIIGNGFDLLHNLPTSYNDFYVYVQNNQPELLEEFDNYFELKDTGDNYKWANFEQDLASFNYSEFMGRRNFIDIQDDNFKLRDVYGLEDEVSNDTETLVEKIRDQFAKWIKSLTNLGGLVRIDLEKHAKFISFNYTNTLEFIYQIQKEQILYIHGYADREDALIFGYGEELSKLETESFDLDGETTRHMFSDAEENSKYPLYAFKKPVREIIKKNSKWFEQLNDVAEINVMGHSLGDVDTPYFQEIHNNAPGAKWIVWGRSNIVSAEKLEKLTSLGISKALICFNLYVANNIGTLFVDECFVTPKAKTKHL